VEHFIRPPVTITVELNVPVSVSCILLCPDLPQEAELRVEVSGGVRDGGVLHRLCVATVTSGYLLVARSRSCTQQVAKLASLVAHTSCWRDLAKFNHVESVLKPVNVLRQLKNLQLRVTRWTGAKPVSIKWLEVWGELSRVCSVNESAVFESRVKAQGSPSQCHQPPKMYGTTSGHVFHSNSPPSMPEIKADLSNSPPSMPKIKADLSNSPPSMPEIKAAQTQNHDIPVRFLDELTFELMILPMLLPSGHFVDQSTVDRLADSDALYGRPPTDPFTGMGGPPHTP
jgi:hypothetical protein